MATVVYVPFAASVIVAALTRVAATRLWPRAAVWAIASAAIALAVSACGALVLLACPLAARVPVVAALGRWHAATVASRSPVPGWVSAAAINALALLVQRTAREIRDLVSELQEAAPVRAAARHVDRDVLVIRDAVPGAHAIGGSVTRRGAVVVTSSMLTLLDEDEQAAVIAHERAHLQRRHAIFLAVARLAAALNPILIGTRNDLRFALERWADEDAALETSRPVLASALAKTSLALLEGVRLRQIRSGFAFHRLGVSERVSALLTEPNRRARPAWAIIAVAAAAAFAFAWATHDTERFFEAVRLWSRR